MGRIRAGRRLSKVAATGVLAVLVSTLAAPSAEALGNNRAVSRSCGTNYVSSGFTGSYNWAQTRKQSGDCSGRLSSAIEYGTGWWTPRAYGTNENAYTSHTSTTRAAYGLHWGCDSCNVTRS